MENEVKEKQLEDVSGGKINIRVFDNCHYSPSHFLDACDPDYWYPCDCARCAYNANRFWENSVCTYPEIVGK